LLNVRHSRRSGILTNMKTCYSQGYTLLVSDTIVASSLCYPGIQILVTKIRTELGLLSSTILDLAEAIAIPDFNNRNDDGETNVVHFDSLEIHKNHTKTSSAFSSGNNNLLRNHASSIGKKYDTLVNMIEVCQIIL